MLELLHKTIKEMKDLNNIINQLGLADIELFPATAAYTSFPVHVRFVPCRTYIAPLMMPQDTDTHQREYSFQALWDILRNQKL